VGGGRVGNFSKHRMRKEKGKENWKGKKLVGRP